MWGRLQSLVLLALALVKTLLLRLIKTPPGIARFNEVYGADGVLSVESDEARVLQVPGACIACGKCDVEQGPLVAASRVGYRGMMAFALSGTRSLGDSVVSAQVISELTDADFVRAEQLCPQHVPLLNLARLVRGHAQRLQAQASGRPN